MLYEGNHYHTICCRDYHDHLCYKDSHDQIMCCKDNDHTIMCKDSDEHIIFRGEGPSRDRTSESVSQSVSK